MFLLQNSHLIYNVLYTFFKIGLVPELSFFLPKSSFKYIFYRTTAGLFFNLDLVVSGLFVDS